MKHIINTILISVAFLVVHPIFWVIDFWKADFTRSSRLRKDAAEVISLNWYKVKKGFNINTVKTLLIVIVLGSMAAFVLWNL